MPKKKKRKQRYKVEFFGSENKIEVTDTKTGGVETFLPVEFVYGQRFYNERVEHYPNYVHKLVWELYDSYKRYS